MTQQKCHQKSTKNDIWYTNFIDTIGSGQKKYIVIYNDGFRKKEIVIIKSKTDLHGGTSSLAKVSDHVDNIPPGPYYRHDPKL